MKVLLQDVIDAIEQTTNELHFFYYMPEEVILCYSEFDQRILDPDFEDEDIDDVLDDSISLPNIQERNDYAIMQDFISTVENNEAYEWLSNSIRGKGAFRMFRATLDRFDLTKDWYDYRDNAYKEIAINWCNEYGIEIIISNPCFEVWFIEHFGYTTKNFNSNAEVIDELKEKIPNYTKSINLHPLIIDKTDIAIKNCKKLENFHDSIGNIGMCRNPSSEVYKIVETINNKQKAF